MKFLCDRCNTRYSIGDERVRGKILKIRCKNCANVITVREGMMADAEGSQPSAPEYTGREPSTRSKKSTTIAPAALNEASESTRGTKGTGGPAGLAGLSGPSGPAGPSGATGPEAAKDPASAVKDRVGLAGLGGPAAAARAPAAAARAPAAAAKAPAVAARESAIAAREPAIAAREPAIAAREPAVAAREPAVAAREPAVAAREPAVAARAPAIAARVGAPGAALAVGAKEPAGAAKERDKIGVFGAVQARRAALSDTAGRGQAGAGLRSAAPEPQRGEPVNALNAAFASAMTKPPPALEEEWYVSIDGDQAGPFSLVEAQHWVAQKAEGADLHCWSEGFDDWLPVDKVSHFRGLRKRPAAVGAPPPLPRVGGVPQRSGPGTPVPAPDRKAREVREAREAEPKPLFAATMASLERATPGSTPVRATPPLGVPSRKNPADKAPNGARELGAARGADRSVQSGQRRESGRSAEAGDNGAPITPKLTRAADVRRLLAARQAGGPEPALSLLDLDSYDASEEGDAATQLEAMPFADMSESTPASQPAVGADPKPSSSDAALTRPHLPASSTLPGTGANAAMTSEAVTTAEASDSGDDLAIGEVSRVVKLADIAGTPRNADRSGPTRRAKTGSVAGGRLTGANPIVRATGSFPSVLGPAGGGAAGGDAPVALAEGDPSLTMAPVRKSHRRGLIVLLSVAGVMVLGVVGAVILFVTTSDESTTNTLGAVRDIDTSRPEDPITHRPIDPVGPVGPGSANPTPNPVVPHPPPRPPRQNPNPNPAGSNHEPDPQGDSLRGDEIEDVARKHQDMTQRCYLRSQRGADGILVGDVKKIAVTLMIDKDGNVNDVQLSDHGADNLGKCLAGSIRGWKFRQSSGGTFRFSLNFVSG